MISHARERNDARPKRNHNLTSLAIFDLFLDVVFMMANITPETVALMETTKLI